MSACSMPLPERDCPIPCLTPVLVRRGHVGRLTVPSDLIVTMCGCEGAEDPRGRVCGRSRLSLRLYARVVAALEGDGGGRRRPDRDAVPRPRDRVAVVADRAEPP